MIVLDLFDTPILPGLALRPDLVTEDEERLLIDAIALALFRFQG